MLALGGNSRSAATLALRQTLGRTTPKFSGSDEAAKSLQEGRRRNKGTRPPIQHSESLDSSIDGDPLSPLSADNEDRKFHSTGKPRGNVASDLGSGDDRSGDLGSGSSTSEESNSEDPGSRGKGRRGFKFRPGKKTSSSSRLNGQGVGGGLLAERLRRLRPNKTKKKENATANRWSNKNAGEQSSLASPMPPESPTSSTPSGTDDQSESDASGEGRPPRGGIVKGKATVDSTQDRARVPLFGGRVTSGSSSGEKGDRPKGEQKRQKNDAVKAGRRAMSGVSGVPLVRESLRQGFKAAWGTVEANVGENHGEAPVAGKGRPAAGMIENLLYGWFGGVVAEGAWPGVGLALRPGFGDQGDRKEVSAAVGRVGTIRGKEISFLRYRVVLLNGKDRDTNLVGNGYRFASIFLRRGK